MQHLTVRCNGALYAEATEERLQSPVLGARAGIYPESTCAEGSFEVTVFVPAQQELIGVGGTYSEAVYYFSDGEFSGRSELRGPENSSYRVE